MHGDSSVARCLWPSSMIHFYYPSFPGHGPPEAPTRHGGVGGLGGGGVGKAEVGWHLICSMVVIYQMSVNPDWMKNGAQRRRSVPSSSLGRPPKILKTRLKRNLQIPPTPPNNRFDSIEGSARADVSPCRQLSRLLLCTLPLFPPSIRRNNPERSSQAMAARPVRPQPDWLQQNSINSLTAVAAAPV